MDYYSDHYLDTPLESSLCSTSDLPSRPSGRSATWQKTLAATTCVTEGDVVESIRLVATLSTTVDEKPRLVHRGGAFQRLRSDLQL